MGNPLEGHFRIFILILTTWGVSMMFSNVLVFPYTVICMTEGKYRWEDFSIDLGTDVFTRVNFDPPKTTAPEVPEVPESPSYWPDFDIPGIKVPTPGFNWQSLRLARTHPDLFLRLLQKVAKEVGIRGAKRVGQALDPRDIDFRKLINGFNLTHYDPNVVFKVKDYVVERIKSLQTQVEVIDTHGRRLSRWENVTANDLKLQNITWNGVINGRVRIQEKAPDHEFSRWERGHLFAISGLGTILSSGPLSRLSQRRLRKTFTVVALISTLATALTPLAAWAGFWVLWVVRFLQGIGFGIVFPTIGEVTAVWAALSETGLFNGALVCFIQIATLITFPLSGWFCAHICWSFAFYFHALLTLVFVIVWWICYRDAPSDSEAVSMSELRNIQDGKVKDFRLRHSRVPTKAIYRDLSIWSVWLAALAKSFVVVTLLFFLPTYFYQVYEQTTANLGWIIGIPCFFQFGVKLGVGILSDTLKLEETLKVKLVNTIAFITAALLLVVPTLLSWEDWECAVTVIYLAITVLGLDVAGFFKSSGAVSRHYAFFVNAHIQAIFGISIFFGSYLITSLIPDSIQEQWILVFTSNVVILVVAAIFFVLKGSGVAASYAATSTLPEQEQLKTLSGKQ